MGKILNVLRQTELQPVPAAEAQSAPAEALPPGNTEEETPFIEIGPQRQIEASPSVLAVQPPHRPTILAPTSPVVETPVGPQPKATPMRVAFRAIPKGTRLVPELIAFHEPDHAISVQYRELFTAVEAALEGDRARALLFAPALPATDGTAVLLNIAITAARQGRRVAVVDGQARQPRLAALLGLPEVPGLGDVLAGTTELEQALQATDQERLFALTGGKSVSNRGPRWAAETTRSVLRRLSDAFDLVLVAGPPWDDKPEVVLLGAACDAVFLIVPEAESNSPQVDHLFHTIPEHGAYLAGCILAS
jgi:Mrp family chromosome partitioning ATPase